MRVIPDIKITNGLINLHYNGKVVGKCRIDRDNTMVVIIDDDHMEDEIKSKIRQKGFELVVVK